MMRSLCSFGTRGDGSYSAQLLRFGERYNYPFRNSLSSPYCSGTTLCRLRKYFLDQLADDDFREFHGFINGDANTIGFVSDPSPEIWRESDSFFTELMLDEQKRDLFFSSVIHNLFEYTMPQNSVAEVSI